MSDLDEYQVWTRSMAQYPSAGTGRSPAIIYTVIGLVDESGEVAGKLKKALRGDGPPPPSSQDDVSSGTVGAVRLVGEPALLSELGDVLWYLARLSDETGFTLSEVAARNREKLESRKARGVIKGSGDAR